MTENEAKILDGADKYAKAALEEIQDELIDDYLNNHGVTGEDLKKYKKDYKKYYKDRKNWHMFMR